MRSLKICLAAAAVTAATASPSLADDGGLLGTLLGAGLGGFAGSNIGHGTGKLVATGAGVLVGGLIGNALTSGPRYYTPQPVYYRPAPVYYQPAPVYYRPAPVYYQPAPAYYAPPQVAYYQPPPAPVTPVNETAYCREGTWQGYVGGVPQQMYGTACRQPDGSWRIMNQ